MGKALSGKDPIWIVNDDIEDRELIEEIFKEHNLPYELQFFEKASELYAALDEVDCAPFIIISEVNLPAVDGFELRERLLATPNNKFHSVPFIFWSNNASEAQVRKAFELRSHGFFIKEASYKEWKATLLQIIRYWEKSRMPSKQDKPDKPLE